MARAITWKIMLTEDKIASVENAQGFPQDKIESHLIIIGLLENLKQKHLDKLNTLYENTKKGKGDEELDL